MTWLVRTCTTQLLSHSGHRSLVRTKRTVPYGVQVWVRDGKVIHSFLLTFIPLQQSSLRLQDPGYCQLHSPVDHVIRLIDFLTSFLSLFTYNIINLNVFTNYITLSCKSRYALKLVLIPTPNDCFLHSFSRISACPLNQVRWIPT